jgi:hypothetical protein
MKTIWYILPWLMYVGFLVMSALNGHRIISKMGMDARAGGPFEVAEARRSALVSGVYMVLSWASLAILGLVPDIDADKSSVIGCSLLMSIPMGIGATIGIYLKAKKAFELGQRLSQSK